MDPMVQRYPVELLGHIEENELKQLIHLLELARNHCQDSLDAVSCNGEANEDGESCQKSAKANPDAATAGKNYSKSRPAATGS
jgi:hypothetical protein